MSKQSKSAANGRLHKLSPASISRAGPGDHHDGGGLFLRVQEDSRTWILRYTSPVTHTRRRMGGGRAQDVPLKAARLWANVQRAIVATGADPLVERDKRAAEAQAAAMQAANGAVTLREQAQRVHRLISPGFKNPKHRAQWLSSIETHVPHAVLDKPIATVTPEDLLDFLPELYQKVRETASRVRQRLESVFDDAALRKLCAGNPATVIRRRLRQLSGRRTKRNFRALPYAQAPQFMQALRKQDGTSARALEFLLLTAARTSEVLDAEWREFDFEQGLWTVPPERMKAGETHLVYLSPGALAIVDAQRGKDPRLVFPSPAAPGAPLSDMAMLEMVRGMGYGKRTVVHGLRSTFSTWAHETHAAPPEVIEAALAHREGDRVAAAYNRAKFVEARRRLLRAWEAFLGQRTAGVRVAKQAA
jgi:integrase